MKKICFTILCCMTIFLIGCGSKMKLKEEIVEVELGEEISTEAGDYIEASKSIMKEAKVDLSNVDMGSIGEYDAVVRAGENEVKFKIKIQDTKGPKITLKDDIRIVIGQELTQEAVAEFIEDPSGVESVIFSEMKAYEEVGENTNEVIATDGQGNTTKQEFTFKVVEDYAAHIDEINDITVAVGSTPDWKTYAKYDERITSVEIDDSLVDMSAVGEYLIVFVFTGDDGETTVEKAVAVNVVKEIKGTSNMNSNSTKQQGSGNTSGSDSGNSSGQKPADSENGGNAGSGGGDKTGIPDAPMFAPDIETTVPHEDEIMTVG